MSLFSNWAEIELYLFINFVLFLLKNEFYYFREVVFWMSWLVLKDFLWSWMNWDIQDFNCQTWSRYKKFFLYVQCNLKTCWFMSLVIHYWIWRIGRINTSIVCVGNEWLFSSFVVPMKENHCIIWLHLSLCWIVRPEAGITSSFFMCDAIGKFVELSLWFVLYLFEGLAR